MASTETAQTKQNDLYSEFVGTRSNTIGLCEPLETEDFLPQPTEDVSPVKWNIAHTTWFFEEMILKKNLSGYQEFDPQFCFLFNSYYNTVGKRTLRHQRGDLSRPTVERVMEYREYVDTHMKSLFQQDMDPEILTLIELGNNHEQQHQELLLTDLKFTLSVNPIDTVYRDDFALVESSDASGSNQSVDIEEGVYQIGHQGDGFCFDNELSRHSVFLHSAKLDSELVSNADYCEFISAGGYKDHRLWHSEGWDWVNKYEVSLPLYWEESNGGYTNYTLAGRRPVDPGSPVCHVSFYEAAAFAEWSGRRLPSEFEWEVASSRFDWGKRWEWTSSAYGPYPGFAVADGAVGEYNGKFMVNQKVLRGASVVTPNGHSRSTYRNFFHPHLRWQFTGIRLAD